MQSESKHMTEGNPPVDAPEVRDAILRVRDLPTLPTVLGKILSAAADPDSSALDLGRLISSDQSLSATLLKLVNSAYYGFYRQIKSVTQAIVMLGFNEVRNLTLTATAFRTLSASTSDYDRNQLWRHTLAAAIAAERCAKMKKLSIGGAFEAGLLHDIGKVAELRYERSFDYSDEGKLLGHIVMGVEMVEDKIRLLPDFPRTLATLVKHLLLSHHGQYEYGSPKRPKTLEAVILNFLDDLDSKINGVRTHIDKEPESGNSWTGYHRLYDRYFFKDTPSGAEALEPIREKRVDPPPPPRSRPEPAVSAAKPAVKEDPEARKQKRNRPLGFSLGDQLKGKSLDLFAADDLEKE